MTSLQPPTLDEKVRHLVRPDAYPEPTSRVDRVETHMATVFLTDRYAYKMKKPIRTPYIDHVELAARLASCLAEVRLNRRLAPAVYLGVVPLALTRGGGLALGCEGEVVEWLVHMHRLPAERMLDAKLRRGAVERAEITALGRRLARFYREAAPAEWSPAEYAARLEADVRRAGEELARPRYGLPRAILDGIVETQIAYLRSARGTLERRAAEGHVVEAHGDLRPEHVCLGPEPVVIDCLEFSRDLRLLDAASELAFLSLECARAGGEWIGRALFDAYADALGDAPPPELVAFYTSHHAMIRSKLAAFHLDDPAVVDAPRFARRARTYVELAARSVPA